MTLLYVTVRVPVASQYIASPDLGRGETDVLRLALELSAGERVVILDDAKAWEAADKLGLKLTGTLGVLLDAKRAGLVPAVAPHLDRLDTLGFRLSRGTRVANEFYKAQTEVNYRQILLDGSIPRAGVETGRGGE